MSPQRVAANTAFLATLLAWDLAVAGFLIAMPQATFRTSAVWQDVARFIPWHQPAVLGFVLGFGAFLILTGRLLQANVAADGSGLVIATASWGLMAASFVSAAIANHGLGYVTASASVAACLFHAGILHYRK
jgi:hypothetical protein